MQPYVVVFRHSCETLVVVGNWSFPFQRRKWRGLLGIYSHLLGSGGTGLFCKLFEGLTFPPLWRGGGNYSTCADRADAPTAILDLPGCFFPRRGAYVLGSAGEFVDPVHECCCFLQMLFEEEQMFDCGLRETSGIHQKISICQVLSVDHSGVARSGPWPWPGQVNMVRSSLVTMAALEVSIAEPVESEAISCSCKGGLSGECNTLSGGLNNI
ncbi:hypothetical protein CDAR_452921 [Caerostris darwini]|uniref:Uncharacterized protein n=1 Tax=Caerostris darwini TaxID=1538125 RepID=A0AAV4Q7A7_9ARAC|nr:hypothetical protein CDAR_452921 [Caerostris darwini]